MAAIFVLLSVKTESIKVEWALWHDVHDKFRENPFTGSEVTGWSKAWRRCHKPIFITKYGT